MRISKTALIILVSMIIFSIFVANVTNLLSNDVVYTSNKDGLTRNKVIPMTDTSNHLLWFLQITDIHISIFRDPSRITEFKEFCDYTIDAIKPTVVLASGDLTDAKTSDNIGSKQFKKEWEHYRNVLNECNIQTKTIWLDIRGNHDNFNVIDLKSKENFFSNYSIQGTNHPRSYLQQIKKDEELYSFIGVDACLEPGPRRPFNFVGMLDKQEIAEIQTLINDVESSGSNYTVWFGHFPTSCIVTTEGEGVKSIFSQLDQSLVYVCGHLHTLGGLVPQMYTLQKEGFLELELGDWKDNRRFRLMAIDHGLLSFIDVQHRDWPVILITNPKDSLFVIPGKENLDIIKYSTHIRILVFSTSKMQVVKFRMDNEKWKICDNVDGPLYVAKWTPTDYSENIHYIHVFAKDVSGRQKIIKQSFSLDGSRTRFSLLSRIALMTDASLIFKIMFGTLLLSTVFPLCLLRILHHSVTRGKMDKPNLRRGCLKTLIRKLWILCTIDRIFWPMVLYPIYLSFGPWSIGHIIENNIGVIFAWGIFINGSFLPGSFTYAYGFLQLFTFQIPLTIILANGIEHRFQFLVLKPGKTRTILSNVSLHLPFIILLSVQIMMAYFFWLAYGTLAFILGPLRTWSIILAILLWYQALKLPEKCTREAAKVWYVKSKPNISGGDLSLNPM